MDTDHTRSLLASLYKGKRVNKNDSIRRRASVLIPTLFIDDEPHILFEERAKTLRSQPGEICFPGGKVKAGESPSHAAIRETCEELMIQRSQIEFLGACHMVSRLSDSYLRSYAGIIKDYKGTFNEKEVARTFTLPLSLLMEAAPDIYDTKVTTLPGDDFPYDMIPGGREYSWHFAPRKIHFYDTPEGVIWGITAELLYLFLEDIKRA